MTKIILITNKSDLTTDFIVKKLSENGIFFFRFNTEELGTSISLSLDFDNRSFKLFDHNLKIEVNLKDFTAVYFRRPEIPKVHNSKLSAGENNFIQGELIYSLEGIYKLLQDAYWISPLYSIREAENKIFQLELAKKIGFEIPSSLVTTIPELAVKFYKKNERDCIIKPIKTGLIEDSSEPKVIFTSKLKDIESELNRIQVCPTYFQKSIKKKADIRVTVIGNTLFPALIHSQDVKESLTDWRKSDKPLKHSSIELPKSLTEKCILLLKSLKLRFAAIDFILDSTGNYIFLEINPNGQWAWIEKQLGYDISGAIVNLLIHENF